MVSLASLLWVDGEGFYRYRHLRRAASCQSKAFASKKGRRAFSRVVVIHNFGAGSPATVTLCSASIHRISAKTRGVEYPVWTWYNRRTTSPAISGCDGNTTFTMPEAFPVGHLDGSVSERHPVRAKKEFFFHVYSWHGKDGLEQVGEESWEELYPTGQLKTENHGPKYVDGRISRELLLTVTLANRVQRLINLAPNVIRTRFMTRPVIDDWTDYTGRIVLLGDAAHPSFVSTLARPSTFAAHR
ncbi:hypothetical protein NUW54_g9089 [Trametes sanguinea]|uniref:Uncharacterized protein n=1 Tax=Trametes sanguinea TaxID=158606 RepID=A0ACC1P8M8_9APHY|nr:hypothetical protein NUW54_g9089 [Trametes sanguinea]